MFEATEIILDIQFGEGGEDSKLFVHDLFKAYKKYAQKNDLKVEVLSQSDGAVQASIRGMNAGGLFQHESGKHCIQRVPPTESKGRRQTSIVTVGVLPVKKSLDIRVEDKDLEVITQGGHGPGGQHQNKTDSAVRMRHLPTGIEVFINGRSQMANRREALDTLTEKVQEHYQAQIDAEYDAERLAQRDGGGRANKVRTYNFIKDRAVDHRFNVKCGDVKSVIEKGRFDRLLKKVKK